MSLASDLQQNIPIAIFASGAGTNAENIIRYFNERPGINVGMIVTNKPEAGVVLKAAKWNIPVRVVGGNSRGEWLDLEMDLRQRGVQLIVLAGYLSLLPASFVKAFRGNIINIHPALLPKFGGKGMYGKNVHRAVLDANEKESGITIHEVNEAYDEGAVLFQKKIHIEPGETPASLEKKIRQLEYYFLPRVIETIIANKKSIVK